MADFPDATDAVTDLVTGTALLGNGLGYLCIHLVYGLNGQIDAGVVVKKNWPRSCALTRIIALIH